VVVEVLDFLRVEAEELDSVDEAVVVKYILREEEEATRSGFWVDTKSNGATRSSKKNTTESRFCGGIVLAVVVVVVEIDTVPNRYAVVAPVAVPAAVVPAAVVAVDAVAVVAMAVLAVVGVGVEAVEAVGSLLKP